jgi:hypothetical protein
MLYFLKAFTQIMPVKQYFNKSHNVMMVAQVEAREFLCTDFCSLAKK